MAKEDSIKILERHVEKLVLAVCAIAMILAIWRWGVNSPTTVKVVKPSGSGTAAVAPAEADKKLLLAANNVQKEYADSDMANSIPLPPAWLTRLDEVHGITPLPVEGARLAMPGRPIKPVEPPGPTTFIAYDDLVRLMLPPTKPEVTGSVELPNRTPLADVIVAKGISTYPLDKVAANWREKLPTIPIQTVVPVKIVVEAQQAPQDGNWANAKTIKVEIPVTDPNMPEIPDFNGNNVKEVRDARDAIFTRQQQILQPKYPPVWTSSAKQWLPLSMPDGDANTIHFFDDSTMKYDVPYRYRVQLTAVNPLLTYGDMVRLGDPKDATRKYITSPPSAWSTPLVVHREIQFFLTSANSFAGGKMIVTVYAKHWGQWVSKAFEVHVGEMIGGVETVELTDPTNGAKRSVEVDFSTGCIVLKQDYKKTIFRPGFTQTTAEMVYTDAAGKIHSRLKMSDDRAVKPN